MACLPCKVVYELDIVGYFLAVLLPVAYRTYSVRRWIGLVYINAAFWPREWQFIVSRSDFLVWIDCIRNYSQENQQLEQKSACQKHRQMDGKAN